MVRATRRTRTSANRPPAPLVRMLSPLRDFLATEASGAILLAAGAVIALVWANSPWSGAYDDLWHSRFGVSLAGHSIDLDLRHWVNDGLMTVFFLVVGLEIKRELTDGHLSTVRAALLPGAAALGGMLVPALVYLAIAGASAPEGWAIPMATDIALAVGVLAVAGDRIPSSMRAFLLGLAIVDDIGAIIIIAAFYSSGVGVGWLVGAAASVLVVSVMRRLGIPQTWPYVVVGTVLWVCMYEGGIHPTLAGVVLGLLAPSLPRFRPELIDADQLADVSDLDAARTTTVLAKGSVSTVEWLQHVLHPWTSYLIIPVFALANSGIEISADGLRDAMRSPITWGVLVGLLAGKPLGVVLATRLAVRAGIADAPQDSTPRHLLGIGSAAGIGFTVALFITELAFDDPVQQSNAKLAILVASACSAVVAGCILRFGPAASTPPAALVPHEDVCTPQQL